MGYLQGFSEEYRQRLAQMTALWVISGLLPPNTLQVIINEHQVKEGVALDFMLEILRVIKTEKGATSVLSLLKKSGLDNNLDQLFPTNKRTAENMKNEKPIKEIIMDLKDAIKKNGMAESEAVAMIWVAVMAAMETNKKEDLIQEQALRH